MLEKGLLSGARQFQSTHSLTNRTWNDRNMDTHDIYVYIKPFSVFIYLFDKQQDHVCHLIFSLHLKVDTIVSIPVLLQYFFPNFSTFNKERKIKHTTTANVRKESMFF